MLNKKITITTPFITLQQLLKLADVISSGGQVKSFLSQNIIDINGVIDNRRGKKLFDGDVVTINKEFCLTVNKK